MKTYKKIALGLFSLICFKQITAQTVNWSASENTKHLINMGIGWDYGLTFSQGYGYKIKGKLPAILNGNISIPSGRKLLDDAKIIVGGQIVIFNKANIKGSIALNGIFRRYENPLVRLLNVGSEMKGTFGYYKPKWFVAGEIGFDKAIITHFKHAETFKENIFQDVKDGWYEPATGGNFYYGLQTGYSFKQYDLTFNIGKVTTQDFKITPTIPYYLTLGFNYKIP